MGQAGGSSSSRLYAHLTKRELAHVLGFVERTIAIGTEEELGRLLLEMPKFVPSTHIISALARTDEEGQFLGSLHLVNTSYPHEWLTRYVERGYARIDPILLANFSTYRAQVWSETYGKWSTTRREKEFMGEAATFGLVQGVTLGVKCGAQPVGSLFSFSGPRMGEHARHLTLLESLVPHLHQALLRVALLPPAADPMLSSREREVLLWIKEGKTNWEISQILRLSERTVRFHVSNILYKLQASTRGQAVAVAMQQGVIGL